MRGAAVWIVIACAMGREELLVWTERYYRDRYLLSAEMPESWTRL